MVVIPLTKNFSWKNPPLLTIALILVNCFVFIFLQHNDQKHWDEALAFYFDSGLGDLELSAFHAVTQADIDEKSSKDMSVDSMDHKQKSQQFNDILGNAEFHRQLERGIIFTEDDPRLKKWRTLRREFEYKLDLIVSYKYGFRPANPRPWTFVTSMFLHGSWGHLIGNMVFLWLLGVLIEYGCKNGSFLIFYILGGIGGDLLFWALNSNSSMPCVGASGAISGIMGSFTVLYGLKRVNIFLNLGFYFNYLKFPALLLLPFWVGHELFQLQFDEMSNVAFAAHLGGLLLGALLAFFARWIPGCLDNTAFVAADENNFGTLMEKALSHMGALEYVRARELLKTALEIEPENRIAWQHIYTIDRQTPDSPQFHETAARLIELLSGNPSTVGQACALFNEYLKTAKPPKLSAIHYLGVSRCFLTAGDLDTARRILMTLVKKACHLEPLPMALFKLAQAFQKNARISDYHACLKMIQLHFPMSSEARVAAEQLQTCQIPSK